MPGIPVVHGERVTLNTVERDDAAFVQRSSTDPKVRIPLGVTRPSNRKQTVSFIEEVIEKGDGVSLLVCVHDAEDEEGVAEGDASTDNNASATGDGDAADTPTPIGMVASKNVSDTRPELVYWFAPEFHRRGYGTEAVGLFVDYLFETFECHGLHIRAFDFNEGSRRVARKVGFREEGCFVEARFVNGEYIDVYHYGLLREEWDPDDSPSDY